MGEAINHDERLGELVELSRWLGAPERDCVIAGEGNTSTLSGDETFFIKSSGEELSEISAEGFVEVRRNAVIDLLDAPFTDGSPESERLVAAKVHPGIGRAPSVETPLHAVCLGLKGVSWVGHTHPTAINAITCANGFDKALSLRLFPDQVVACGPRSLRVPLVSPGIELGRVLRAELVEYLDRWGEAPKTIYMRNHGFVALGSTAHEVRRLTLMAIKAARILAGAEAFGGPHDVAGVDLDGLHSPPEDRH